jgi:hypothetical protein
VVKEALAQLPIDTGYRVGRTVLVRADAGGATHDFLNYLTDRRKRELSEENRRLRCQLACALGRLCADTGRCPPLIGYSTKGPKGPYSEAGVETAHTFG